MTLEPLRRPSAAALDAPSDGGDTPASTCSDRSTDYRADAAGAELPNWVSGNPGLRAALNDPRFRRIGPRGVPAALRDLDVALVRVGLPGVVYHPWNNAWVGRELGLNQLGHVVCAGLPQVVLEPGRHVWFDPRVRWAEPAVVSTLAPRHTQLGLSFVNLAQNQVAVVSGPDQRAFSVAGAQGGGYVAYGPYRLLEVINWLDLMPQCPRRDATSPLDTAQRRHIVYDPQAPAGDSSGQRAVAFDVPYGEQAVVQRGNDLAALPPGQYVLTEAQVKLLHFRSTRETESSLALKQLRTKNNVELDLRLNVKWRLQEPLKFAQSSYQDPWDLLEELIEASLSEALRRLSYEDFQDCTDDLLPLDREVASCQAALAAGVEKYGVELLLLAVRGYQFRGNTAAAIDNMGIRAIYARAEEQVVRLEGRNALLRAQGRLEVARTEGEIAAAGALAQADAEAKAIGLRAAAHRQLESSFEQSMALARLKFVDTMHALGSSLAGFMGPLIGLLMGRRGGDVSREAIAPPPPQPEKLATQAR